MHKVSFTRVLGKGNKFQELKHKRFAEVLPSKEEEEELQEMRIFTRKSSQNF